MEVGCGVSSRFFATAVRVSPAAMIVSICRLGSLGFGVQSAVFESQSCVSANYVDTSR